ncbi:MAG: VOC family protein [bacterium]|nr:VOC family protein [bacterium]
MTANGLFRKVDTVMLRVADLEKSRAWYREKLGVKELFGEKKENLVVISFGGDTSITLWQLKEGQSLTPGAKTGCFPILMSDDVRRAHRTLSERGVQTEPVQSGGSVQWFAFYDLDGNRIEVCEVFA